ncbi:MAG: PglL family O-oligosaccharyltransferase, partial [Rhodoferax sp.]
MQSLNVWMLAGSVVMGLGWLLPNTYHPWLSAWLEAAALVSVVFFCTAWFLGRQSHSPVATSLPLAIIAVVVVLSLFLQTVSGVIFFAGDAVMVITYLLAWLLAVHAGSVVASFDRTIPGQHLDLFFAVVMLAAISSVGLAIVQWLGIEGLNIFVLDLAPGGRPYANLGQPNNFSTLCFLGCASLLYFYERGAVRNVAFWMGWLWLTFGMALSQSRTGWLQIACLAMGVFLARKKSSLRIKPRMLIGLATVLAVWVVLVPILSEYFNVTVARTLTDQMQGGVRWTYWAAMLQAIGERPWIGYGWLQTGLAQQAGNSSAINLGLFDFSHNVVLDVIIWVGIPMGLVIVLCMAIWLMDMWRHLNSGRAVMVFMAVFGVLVHALLEYPLAYAYFLVPFGFLMGALQGLVRQETGLMVGRRLVFLVSGVFVCLLSVVGHDYFSAESATRRLRLESAHIGPQVSPVSVPNMMLLTQM